MGKTVKDKIIFILPPVILAIVTFIWYFAVDGRWYQYRQEWAFGPLLVAHLIMPVYYFVRLIIAAIMQIKADTRSLSNIFYIVASVVLCFFGVGGLFLFLVFTSGA
ncbi:MAG: hypothetical protein K6B69_13400 [Lachnospiraceae bacterium]|nr:hypothetical protein [Lachnospiraceae bacterium]